MKSTIKFSLKLGAAPLVLGMALAAAPAYAQTKAASADDAPVIVVTGSSIKVNPDKSTLPVTVVSAADIAKSGFTSVTDVVQNLPAMQGFVAASASVNGGGGGVTTAAVHGLGSKYTLVLLDGQRIAPTLGGTINIEGIPVDAISGVDVLRDGAGAIYGADAIAGVVNFHLKKDITEGNAYVEGAFPGKSGGSSWSAGFSKGFGKLSADGFNVFVSYSHDEQKALAASQRAISSQGGVFNFTTGGNNYIFFSPSSNTAPANITVAGKVFNPFYVANGNCGTPNAFPLAGATGLNCRFNYAATVQDIPSSKRDSGLVKGSLKVGDDGMLSAALTVSKYDMVAQYAPPAQPMGLNATTRFPALWNKYVVPFLTANGLTATSATLNYRAVQAGGRADDYGNLLVHASLGYDGKIGGFDVHAALVNSHTVATDTAAGGYMDFTQFTNLVASGTYDPVMGTGGSSLAGAVLHSQFSKINTNLTSFNVQASHKLFDLPGGTSILSVGAEYDKTSMTELYSSLIMSQNGFSDQPASSDYPVGGNYGQVPFNGSRSNWSAFAEWELPILHNLEVNAQGRYDGYSKVHSNFVFSTAADPVTGLQNQIAPADLGNTFNAVTGKVSFRYTPVKVLSIRGSVGTGFRAPAITDISGALTFAGSTSGTYACPIPGSAGCLPGSAQYDVLSGPNGNSGSTGLKPEKSVNWGLGASFNPTSRVFMNIDYWNVKISNQILSGGIPEQLAFANPTAYSGLFINNYIDPGAGFTTIGYMETPFNGGEAKYSGIDWDVGFAVHTGLGKLRADWSGTYMLNQKYTLAPGADFVTDLGLYGPDQQVVFKTISALQLSLQSGALTNTINAHYKSGYIDEGYTPGNAIVYTSNNGVRGVPTYICNPSLNGSCANGAPQFKVPSFVTFDWQGVYEWKKRFTLTAGVKNIFDRAPPLSLQSGGGGNQVGYDGRYYDPTGRTFYLRGNVKF